MISREDDLHIIPSRTYMQNGSDLSKALFLCQKLNHRQHLWAERQSTSLHTFPSACNDAFQNKDDLSTEVSGKWRGQLGRANSIIHTFKILKKTLIAKDQNTEKSKYLLKWNHWFDSSLKRNWKEKHKQVIELILWAQTSKLPRVTFQESFFPYRHVMLWRDQHVSTSLLKKVQKKHFPGWKAELSFSYFLGTEGQETVKQT